MARGQSSSGALLLADKIGKLRPLPERCGGHFGYLKKPIEMNGKTLIAPNFFIPERIFFPNLVESV